MLVKLMNIIDGWKNYTFPSPEVEKVAKERAAICAQCPHAQFEMFVDVIEFRAVEMHGYVCEECKCPITKAVRSMSYSCPINKWDAVS
jgi:hypothetical protein